MRTAYFFFFFFLMQWLLHCRASSFCFQGDILACQGRNTNRLDDPETAAMVKMSRNFLGMCWCKPSKREKRFLLTAQFPSIKQMIRNWARRKLSVSDKNYNLDLVNWAGDYIFDNQWRFGPGPVYIHPGYFYNSNSNSIGFINKCYEVYGNNGALDNATRILSPVPNPVKKLCQK